MACLVHAIPRRAASQHLAHMLGASQAGHDLSNTQCVRDSQKFWTKGRSECVILESEMNAKREIDG